MADIKVIVTNPKNRRSLTLYCGTAQSLKRTLTTAAKRGNTYKIVLPKDDVETADWALDTMFSLEAAE
jgi:hypothetical protein